MYIFHAAQTLLNIIIIILCDICTAIGQVIDSNDDMPIVLAGDMNFEFSNRNSGFQIFKQWFEDFKMSAVLLDVDSPTAYTYDSSTGRSCIDHVVVSNDLLHSVSPIHTIDSGINLSDHLPIATQVPVSPYVTCNSRNSLKCDETLRMRWDKANLPAYYNTTYENLYAVADMECLDNCSMHCDCSRHGIIDNYYLCVVHALQTADTYSVPRKKASYYKFWWNVEASELKYKSVDAHRLWVAAGRPRNGDCFNRMHNAKLEYKLCLRKLRNADTEGISNELNDCLLQKDTDSFWKCWKSKFNSPKPVVHAVNGCTNDIDIAETFVDFFSRVCRPKSILQNDQLRDQFLAQFEKYVGAETDLSVSINAVASSICRLKKGKAPAIDGIMAEHLINCHPIIYCVLQKLFKAIVSHRYVPIAFGAGIVIPLLKNSG